jgi:hypothetical protein
MRKTEFTLLAGAAGCQLLQERTSEAFQVQRTKNFPSGWISMPASFNDRQHPPSDRSLAKKRSPLYLAIDPSQLSEVVQSIQVPPSLPSVPELPQLDLSGLRPFEMLTHDLTNVVAPSAEVESKLFKDMSHVLLDLFIFLQPDTYMLRLAIVFGQLFGWASNLVADRAISPDDLFFQLITFPVSVFLMVRSLWPVMKAFQIELDYLDLIAYKQIFDPVGVSLLQLKSLKAAGALEWVHVDPGTILVDENEVLGDDESETQTSDELGNPMYYNEQRQSNSYVGQEGCAQCLYWLYKGDVKVSYNGRLISYIERNNGRFIDDPNSSGLLADMRFLYQMDEKIEGTQSKSQSNYQNRILSYFQNPFAAISDAEEEEDIVEEERKQEEQYGRRRITYPMTTMVIGDKGGTLLRMDSVKLLQLMEDDNNLSDSMRRLMLKSLQRKVGHLLDSQTRTNRGGCDWSVLEDEDDGKDFASTSTTMKETAQRNGVAAAAPKN